MTRKEAERQEQQEAIKELREMLKPGDTVYTHVNRVSRSGMSRIIDVMIIKDNIPLHINWEIEKLGLYKRTGCDQPEGLKVGGCGMDMGFSVVYNLSRTLFQNNYTCTGKGCFSNDHANGDRNYKPHKHSDGGYALKQRWM